MKIKNMSKRAISVFLSLMMCVSLLQVPAFAATEPQYDEFGNLITTDATTTTEPETPVVTEPVVPETPVVPEDDAVVDNNSDVDVDTDADTEDDADANADADVEGDADANADADTEDDADANADANAEDNADANADADAEDDADANADANAEDNADANADANAEDNADANADADAEDNADANADADAEDEADANADADVEDEADANADANVEDDANVNADANVEDDADVNAGADTVAPEDIGIQTLSLENPAVTAVSTVNELLDAISKAKDNEEKATEITLSGDITTDTEIVIDAARNIALNLCGKTITGATGSLFTVEGNLTIKDEPQSNDDTGSEGKITNSKGRGFVVKNGGSLTLESGSITGNKSQDNGGGVIILKDSTFTMNGGSISNNSSASHRSGGGVYVDHDATFIMNDGTIAGNTTAHEGGGVFVDRNATFTMNGGTIDKNSAQNGGGVYVNGGKFTMDNDATISNNTAAGYTNPETTYPKNDLPSSSGGGVYVDRGDFTMNAGTITGNTAGTVTKDENGKITSQDTTDTNRGGGVYIAKGTNEDKAGIFTMNGGSIDNNVAGEGGGIFLELGPKWDSKMINHFTMSGGSVSDNTAFVGEGGGIYIRGEGKITKGSITGNVTHTEKDLGGGGIYVESDAVLTIVNALVTENFAQGLGAGLAACVHGKTSLINVDGAAIFGNTNHYDSNRAVGYVKNSKTDKGEQIPGTKLKDFIDAYTLWMNDNKFQSEAKDIFTASDKSEKSQISGTPGAIIGNMMLNSVMANWTGTTVNYDQDGKLVWTPVNGDAAVYSDRLLGLTANVKDTDQEKMTPSVIISGNYSTNTHGGGIANNGTLFLGSQDPSDQFNSDLPEIKVDKNLTPNEPSADSKPVTGIPTDGEFTFDLTSDNKTVGNLTLNLKDMVLGTDNTTSSGTTPKFTIGTTNFDVSKFGEGETIKEFTFTVTENEPENKVEGVTYDKAVYRVTVTIEKGSIKETVGNITFDIPTYTFGKTLKYEKLSADGTWSTVDNITFNNTYKPDTPEEKPENTESIDDTLPEMFVEKTFEVKQGTPSDQGEFVFDILDKSENGNTLASVTISVKDCLTDPVRVALPLANAIKALRPDAGKLENTTLFVKERNNNIDGVTYSENMYQIDLNVKESVTDKDDGSTHTVYSYADPVITMFGDSATGDVDGTVLKFVNVYDKPEEPSTPPTTPEKPNEPSTPPTTPDRPSRPTPPPTPEEPTIDIPDDDVPLAPAPEEPEVSIPDEDVPLAGEPPLVELPEPEVPLAPMPPETTTIPDPEVPLAGVPQTGDNAGGFYALMALAACGLVVLNLRKKENEI